MFVMSEHFIIPQQPFIANDKSQVGGKLCGSLDFILYSFCFICIESAEGSHPSLEKLVRFIENLQNCETFCLSQEFDECFIRVSHIGSLMEVLITLHVY